MLMGTVRVTARVCVCVCLEHRDAEDNVYDVRGAGGGVRDTEWWTAGERETVGELEVCSGGWEESGRAQNSRPAETAGQREAEPVRDAHISHVPVFYSNPNYTRRVTSLDFSNFIVLQVTGGPAQHRISAGRRTGREGTQSWNCGFTTGS